MRKVHLFISFVILSFFGTAQTLEDTLAMIEQQYGEQWDFCTCVIKHDSINKAFAQEMNDDEFNALSERFDQIDTHCKAFLVMNPVSTSEQRMLHRQKVKACLEDEE